MQRLLPSFFHSKGIQTLQSLRCRECGVALLQSLLERMYIDSHLLLLNSKSAKEMTKIEDIWESKILPVWMKELY